MDIVFIILSTSDELMDLQFKTSKNAITAQELFRLYPSLSPFLVSLLKEYVKGTFVKDSLSSESILHPSLFPILLLLSRLQPVSYVAADVGAIESVEPFIEPVLVCLSHPHHKVRLMASRSIGALCAGDGEGPASMTRITSWCLEILSKDSICGYNFIHGILMCLSQLIQSQGSKDWFEKIKPFVLKIAHINKHLLSYPPSCVSVALNVWQIARRKQFIQNSANVSLDTACISAIKTSIKVMSINVVGSSHLCCEASKILIREIFSDIFSLDVPSEIRQRKIQMICWLMELPFDSSWIVVKTFKKPLFNTVKSIVGNFSIEASKRAEVSIYNRRIRTFLFKIYLITFFS